MACNLFPYIHGQINDKIKNDPDENWDRKKDFKLTCHKRRLPFLGLIVIGRDVRIRRSGWTGRDVSREDGQNNYKYKHQKRKNE